MYNYQQPKKHKKLKIFMILLLVLVLAFGGWWAKNQRSMRNAKEVSSADTVQPEPTPDASQVDAGQVAAETSTTPIRLIATGDMLPHETVNVRAKKDSDYDYMQFMQRMKPFFDKADLRFCNQAVLGGGEQFGLSGYPVFNSPTQVQRDMAALGCNIVNTGTNHTNDKDQAVIDVSVAEWDKYSSVVAVAGANRSADEQSKPRYFTVRGINFAMVSYASYTNKPNPNAYSLNMYNKDFATQQISDARLQSDIVIVSMRWGTEYSPNINADQDRIAQELSDMGADIILGHGPHVMEPVKRLKGQNGRETLVWFSLGNFLNAQLNVEDLTGCMANMEIDPLTKTVTRATCLPIYSFYEWSADEKAKGNLLARRSFEMMPLEEATADHFSRQQLGTNPEAQIQRIQSIVNTFTEIPIIKVAEF